MEHKELQVLAELLVAQELLVHLVQAELLELQGLMVHLAQAELLDLLV
jgi:hypothetical protein